MKVQKEAQSHHRKTLEPSKGAWKDGALDGLLMIHVMLRLSGQQLGESTCSKLQNLDMRIQGSQTELPASGDANAKWRAKISTRVSINPNHKHALKTVS